MSSGAFYRRCVALDPIALLPGKRKHFLKRQCCLLLPIATPKQNFVRKRIIMTMLWQIIMGIAPITAMAFIGIRSARQQIMSCFHIAVSNGIIQSITVIPVKITTVFPEDVQGRDQPFFISCQIIDKEFLCKFRSSYNCSVKQVVPIFIGKRHWIFPKKCIKFFRFQMPAGMINFLPDAIPFFEFSHFGEGSCAMSSVVQ